ncbi:hypothetical protein CANARDRAFT_227180, partial [[Candida] arabinofermentans NRRL YB-2248]
MDAAAAQEEQQQEIEILESIYPDELNIISPREFTINLLLDVESERKHALLLHVRYPELYPDVVPELTLDFGNTINKNLLNEDYDSDDDDDDDDDGELLRKLKLEAEENIGMPSIFTLTSSLKDQAENLFNEKLKESEKKIEDERLQREIEAQKKFVGTKVSPESFENWRVKFREEMGHNKRLDERFSAMHQGRLTGKEIFEKGLDG